MSNRLTSATVEVTTALEAIETYYERGWTDGLPVVPPTPEAVTACLEAARLAPEQILGVETTKGAVITAEKAAINAVAAGCLPEYMPVVAAAVEAMTTDEFSLHAITVSTMGAGILLVVNGPIAGKIGINSGVSVFGPGHRANATIGRAIRLIVMNVLRTQPGDLDKATLGHPGKYSWCIAEAESRLPWEPLHVSRGLSASQSAVTVFAGLSGLQFGEHAANTPEGILDAFIDRLYSLGPGMREVVIVMCPEHAAYLKSAGWSRAQVQGYIFENARRPASEWARSGIPTEQTPKAADPMTAAVVSPEAVVPIVTGGDGGAWSMVIPTWSFGAKSRSVTRQIAARS